MGNKIDVFECTTKNGNILRLWYNPVNGLLDVRIFSDDEGKVLEIYYDYVREHKKDFDYR